MKQKRKKTTNILIIIPSSYGGGAERLVLNQLQNTTAKDLSLNVVSLRKGNIEPSFAIDDRYQSMDAHCRLSLKTLIGLNQIVTKRRIDILHCHLLEAEFYGLLLKMFHPRMKLLCTRHIADDPLRQRPILRILIKLISFGSNKILAVSEDVKTFTVEKEHANPAKVSVLMNGVDHHRFRRKKREDMRKKLRLGEKDFCVGIVGRLVPQKGHHYLLEAIASLKRELPRITLLVIGKGELEDVLRAQCVALGIEQNVKFLGFRNDLPELYSAMDVLCLPSIFEGFGLVIVEAMLCKTPVVATRLRCVTEIATDEQEALLVEPGNAEELARALRRIHDGEYDHRMIGRAYAKSLREYTFDKNLGELESLYRGLAWEIGTPFFKRFAPGKERVMLQEARKVAKLHEIAEATGLFRAPALLGTDIEGRCLRLERVTDAQELRRYLFRKNNILHSDKETVRRRYVAIGRALAAIHDRLALETREYLDTGNAWKRDGKDECFLHGDIGLSNILIKGEEIWIIDPSTSSFQGLVNPYGPFYYDLAQLIVYTRSVLPLAYLPFYRRKNCAAFEEALLEGYARERRVAIDRRKLGRMEQFILERYRASLAKRRSPAAALRRWLVTRELERSKNEERDTG